LTTILFVPILVLLVLVFLLMSIVITCDFVLFNDYILSAVVREIFFMAGAVISPIGFQNTTMVGWSAEIILFFAVFSLIEVSVGSVQTCSHSGVI
ncbi:MAG TPA: hypothetical protein O0X64_03140, partial [Methanocorpusculum sp.]|nr:hypothetical protein [Methanocorpusculum sp.]